MNNILIISHPRSGSYWFQESLNRYDTNELFNLKNIDVEFFHDRLVISNYANKNLSELEKLYEYERRSKIFDSIIEPKSIKIHHYQLTPWVKDWILNSKNLEVIFLERKNKTSAFYSLIISNALKKFKGIHKKKLITININDITECWNSIFVVDPFIDVLKQKLSWSHWYYEDALHLKKTEWFDPDRAKILKQNTVSEVKIQNIDQINLFLKEHNYDISAKRIF